MATLALLTLGSLVGPATVEAAPPEEFQTACPEMTDSIYRLYTAYFGRQPDPSGWAYWLETYALTNAGLPIMSQAFADSQEFINTYGSLDDAAFVELVYLNVLGRVPDFEGLRWWTDSLENGYPRGSLMIAFSESPEYVNATDTLTPLSGSLQWYTGDVYFNCGGGTGELRPERLPDSAWADLIVWNLSDTDDGTYVWGLHTPSGTERAAASTVPAGFFEILWNMPIHELAAEDVFIETDDPNLLWTIVIYDHPHAETRAPYTDGAAAALTGAAQFATRLDAIATRSQLLPR